MIALHWFLKDLRDVTACGLLILSVCILGPLVLCGKENRKAWFKEVREGWDK